MAFWEKVNLGPMLNLNEDLALLSGQQRVAWSDGIDRRAQTLLMEV